MGRLLCLILFLIVLNLLITLSVGNVYTLWTTPAEQRSIRDDRSVDQSDFYTNNDDIVNIEDDQPQNNDNTFNDLGKYGESKHIKYEESPDDEYNSEINYNRDKDIILHNEKLKKRSEDNENYIAKVSDNDEFGSTNDHINPVNANHTINNNVTGNHDTTNVSNGNLLENMSYTKKDNNAVDTYIKIVDQQLANNFDKQLSNCTRLPFENGTFSNSTISINHIVNCSINPPATLANVAGGLQCSGDGQSTPPGIQNTGMSSGYDDLGTTNPNSKKGSGFDEQNVARRIKDFVRNLLNRAGKTGSMRKELGLCKTYENEYMSVKNANMEDEFLKGMMSCLNKISGSAKQPPCGDLQPDLVQFLDWLLLDGVSARDALKQSCANGQTQRKQFLFPLEESAYDEWDNNNNTSNGLYAAPKRHRIGYTNNFNNKTSLFKQFKGALMGGLTPYIRNDNRPRNMNANKVYYSSNV